MTLAIDNPFLEWLGASLDAWTPDSVEIRLPITPQLGNRTGRVQGGVLCTLLDAACGYAGLHTPPDQPKARSLTLSLTTQFLDSGPGSILIAKGFMQRRGRSVYFSRGELWMDSGELVATAVGTFKYLRPQ